ncbi:hypothetical protein TeGR_g6154, partial [Tetraparma gracilis]
PPPPPPPLRTRTGQYSLDTSGGSSQASERNAEDALHQFSDNLKQSVLKSATVMNTSLMAKFGGLVEEIDNLAMTEFTVEKHKKEPEYKRGRVTKVYPGGNAYDVEYEDKTRQIGVPKRRVDSNPPDEANFLEATASKAGKAAEGFVTGMTTGMTSKYKKLHNPKKKPRRNSDIGAAAGVIKAGVKFKKGLVDDDDDNLVDDPNFLHDSRADEGKHKEGSLLYVTIQDEHDSAAKKHGLMRFYNYLDLGRCFPALKDSRDIYKHGQYKFTAYTGTFGKANAGLVSTAAGDGMLDDDHHSPLSAEQYLKFRVRPMLHFYQSRLPTYSKRRGLYEGFVLLGSLAATLLAFMKLSHWAAVPASLAAAVTAFSEFNGTEKKLLRYSDCISGLDSILLWWRTLTDVERAGTSNVTELVQACENVFQSERQAWVSTSMGTKKEKDKKTGGGKKED